MGNKGYERSSNEEGNLTSREARHDMDSMPGTIGVLPLRKNEYCFAIR